ncbi:LysR family transcriptional regulator [Kribbella sandramycini]|uniref:DNA-binding transcriptional LysR family regulator n=1 Tax=Kribbella sandramycini TaxID=60450 RepID=A0A7Y4KU95_9ACTN|nr:LysR substrate-binding domain-containing protein [Kribbella sandramycini]MBB6568595.1 DNA-binding transcriptional LysR family regulator [Kribbella sandramycini]NOL38820.1 LysR family transcriptional regulator [Kribbella sandramycini]
MDVDLRKLRYFVAVAEELHFGRAADRLHIAQPVLSRQIRALEHELGAQLFHRTKRATELTPAGRQLLDDARPLLTSAAALRRRVAQAARGPRTFTIAFMPGITLTAAVRAFETLHPGIDVEVLRTSTADQVQVLHDGRADVSIVRLPIDQRALTLRPLYEEPRLAILPAHHRLAGKPSIEISDLAEEHLLQHPDQVPEWRDLPREPRHRPIPALNSVEEKLEHVAAGRGISILPSSVAAFYHRPDITAVPLTDLPPNKVALAWLATRRSPLIQTFVTLTKSLTPTSPPGT